MLIGDQVTKTINSFGNFRTCCKGIILCVMTRDNICILGENDIMYKRVKFKKKPVL